MPELPEVETLRRGLSAAITGRRILSVCILDRKIFPEPDEITGSGAAGYRVGRVGRRGKVVILFLDGSGSLLIHPKMTGQLVLTAAGATVLAGGHPTPSMLAPMPNPTTRAVFRLDQAAVCTTTTRGDSAGSAWQALTPARATRSCAGWA